VIAIATDVANTLTTNKYEWHVNDTINGSLKVRVTSSSDSDAYDISDNYFKIRAPSIYPRRRTRKMVDQ